NFRTNANPSCIFTGAPKKVSAHPLFRNRADFVPGINSCLGPSQRLRVDVRSQDANVPIGQGECQSLPKHHADGVWLLPRTASGAPNADRSRPTGIKLNSGKPNLGHILEVVVFSKKLSHVGSDRVDHASQLFAGNIPLGNKLIIIGKTSESQGP